MITNTVYQFFADYIFKNSGILYKPEDFYRLESRIVRLMQHYKMTLPEDLMKKFSSSVSSDDHAVLINTATNNETYFFRDNKPFNALTKGMLPDFLKNTGEKIFIWSAGCSTGQEPYSILMKVSEEIGAEKFSQIQLDASDLSTDALSKARRGNYDGLEVQRGLPIKLLMKFFQQEKDETWTVQSTFRDKIHFFQFNFLKDNFPKNKYHVIFCRNVLIYQNSDNRRLILQKFYEALKPGGFLIMGNGESMIGVKIDFKSVMLHEMMTFQK